MGIVLSLKQVFSFNYRCGFFYEIKCFFYRKLELKSSGLSIQIYPFNNLWARTIHKKVMSNLSFYRYVSPVSLIRNS